jgi:beta-lactam-binding protein with PASTA domain
VPKDNVITQNPNGGQLAVGETITLTVSTGPDQTQPQQIQMPSLVGMTFEDAQAKLQSMGWSGQLNQRADRTSGQPEGTITGQNPRAGTMIDKNQTVTVNVAESLFPTSTTKTSGP